MIHIPVRMQLIMLSSVPPFLRGWERAILEKAKEGGMKFLSIDRRDTESGICLERGYDKIYPQILLYLPKGQRALNEDNVM